MKVKRKGNQKANRKKIKQKNVPMKRNNNKLKDKKKSKPTSKCEVHQSRPIPRRKTERDKNMSLRERMLERLKSSQFRYINEEMYTMRGSDALTYFKKEPEAFQAYHTGYQQQVEQWPVDPLDIIIDSLKKQCTSSNVIADFGCGTARLAKALTSFKVHSFDLVSLDPLTTVCDMASTPLPSASVDFVVCCLSLMGTNFGDYVKEANRVLKIGGILKIAEVESRFDKVETFLQNLEKYGFKTTHQDLAHQLFYFFDLKKERNIGKGSKKKLPDLALKPCLYKKR